MLLKITYLCPRTSDDPLTTEAYQHFNVTNPDNPDTIVINFDNEVTFKNFEEIINKIGQSTITKVEVEVEGEQNLRYNIINELKVVFKHYPKSYKEKNVYESFLKSFEKLQTSLEEKDLAKIEKNINEIQQLTHENKEILSATSRGRHILIQVVAIIGFILASPYFIYRAIFPSENAIKPKFLFYQDKEKRITELNERLQTIFSGYKETTEEDNETPSINLSH